MFLIVVWILCGLAGGHLAHKLCLKHDDMHDWGPSDVWLCAFGPALLGAVIFLAFEKAFK